MEMTRRKFLAGLTTGAAALGLAACGTRVSGAATVTAGAPRAASPNATPVTAAASERHTQVRVGYVPVLIYAPLFIAIEKGYFAGQGIEPVLTPLAGGADIITQTVAGNFEIGLGGMGAAALNAAKRNLDFRIVASHHSESAPLATPLVVARKKFDDGTFRAIADLKGKKVAINARGSASEYWLQAALAKGGLTPKDVELIALPFDQVAAALDGGALDAALLGEPLVTLAEQKGLVARLADDFLADAQGTVIFYNLDWARRERDLADRWLAAWLRGARDLQGDGYGVPEHAAIIERYTKVPQGAIVAASPPRHHPDGRLNLADMQAQQEYFLRSGSLTYADLIDLATIVDTTYAERAVALIG